MSLTIAWTPEDGGDDQVIDFDCHVTAAYENSADITEHPVESGANISDNARAQNESITIEAIVTNTPIETPFFGTDGATGSVEQRTITVDGKNAAVSVFAFSQQFDRRKAVDDQLRALVEAGQVLNVSTDFRSIDNCLIARYKVDRSAENGDNLSLTLELKRVRIATTQRVQAPQPRQRRGQRTNNRGSQQTTDDPSQNRSALRSLQLALGGS